MKGLGIILLAIVAFLVLSYAAHFMSWHDIHAINHWANTHQHCNIVNTGKC